MPYLAQVRYIFPFRLSLPEAFFRVKREDFIAGVRVWSGVADRSLILRAPQDRKPEQGRKTLRSKNTQDGMIHRTVLFNDDDDLYIEEVTDTVWFTRMDVTFECPGEVPPSDSPIFMGVREKAIGIAQQFVRAYRTVSVQVDVKVPSEMDSPLIEISVSTNYTFTRTGYEAIFTKVLHAFQWLPPAVTGASKGPLSPERLEGLIAILDQGIPTELFRELLLESRELSSVNGNHRLALVIAQTGFETYIQWRLILECKHRTIALLRDKKGKESDVETAIAKGNLRDDLLGVYMTLLVGRSIKDSTEHGEWYINAYEPRNQIVHRGRVNVTQQDAESAFESVEKYCVYIDRMLNESRPPR